MLRRQGTPGDQVPLVCRPCDTLGDVGQFERVCRRLGLREVPLDAQAVLSLDLHLARLFADRERASVHRRADEIDAVGPPGRNRPVEEGERPFLEADDDCLGDPQRSAFHDFDARVEAFGGVVLGVGRCRKDREHQSDQQSAHGNIIAGCESGMRERGARMRRS